LKLKLKEFYLFLSRSMHEFSKSLCGACLNGCISDFIITRNGVTLHSNKLLLVVFIYPGTLLLRFSSKICVISWMLHLKVSSEFLVRCEICQYWLIWKYMWHFKSNYKCNIVSPVSNQIPLSAGHFRPQSWLYIPPGESWARDTGPVSSRGGTQKSFIRGGSASRSNPLPFYIPFFQKSHPFRIPSEEDLGINR